MSYGYMECSSFYIHFSQNLSKHKTGYHFQSNLNNCLEDGTFVLNWYVTALPAQPQSIIGLLPSSTTWQRRQVRCRLITKALMREPAAAWSCRNPCCLAGLMAIPWGHTLVLPQHAGKYGSNHKSPAPRDLFLKSEADRCEEGKESKTRGWRNLIRKRRPLQGRKKVKQGGRVQIAVQKGKKGALKFWTGWVKCLIYFLLLKINLPSSQHFPNSNRSSRGGHLQF